MRFNLYVNVFVLFFVFAIYSFLIREFTHTLRYRNLHQVIRASSKRLHRNFNSSKVVEFRREKLKKEILSENNSLITSPPRLAPNKVQATKPKQIEPRKIQRVISEPKPIPKKSWLKVYHDFLSYPHKKPLKIRCETCAYVTGSGHLLGSKQGNEIDSKDCVFRSNDAPTIGYEDDVGSKTTFRTLGITTLDYISKYLNQDPTELHLLTGTEYILFLRPDKLYFLKKKLNKYLSKLTIHYLTAPANTRLNQSYVDNVGQIGGHVFASNGYVSVWIARQMCEVLHVYGITNSGYCESARKRNTTDFPYHYYLSAAMKLSPSKHVQRECEYMKQNEENPDTKLRHLFTKEKEYFYRLKLSTGKIFFHVPEW